MTGYMFLTLKVPVTAIDALQGSETVPNDSTVEAMGEVLPPCLSISHFEAYLATVKRSISMPARQAWQCKS